MTWTLVGYFSKRRPIRSRWTPRYPDDPNVGYDFSGAPVSAPVDEVCSVSDCIAQGPEGWRDQGKHNFYDMYNAPDLAWSVVPVEVRSEFELFAYLLHLVEFEDGREEPMEQWCDLTVEPMPGSFVRLGWDAVQGGNHVGFGCSPLTCNNKAGNAGIEVGIPRVNRYGLVSTEQDGIELARHFSITKPEPGPYCVVDVWREAVSRS